MKLSSLFLFGAIICPMVAASTLDMKLYAVTGAKGNAENAPVYDGQYVSSYKVDSTTYQLILDKKENAVTFSYDESALKMTFSVENVKYYVGMDGEKLVAFPNSETTAGIFASAKNESVNIDGTGTFNTDTSLENLEGKAAIELSLESIYLAGYFSLYPEITGKGTSGSSGSASGSTGGSDTSDSDSKSSTATSKGPKTSAESSTKATSSKNHAERNGFEGPAAAAVALGLLMI